MDAAEIAARLAGPHMCVFAVARVGKGPVAVPLAYIYREGRFYLQTARDSLHGRLAAKRGRATVTVHQEQVESHQAHEWYVTAEGPIEFTKDPVRPIMRAMMAKDRGDELADRWLDEWLWPVASDQEIMVLTPDRIVGYTFDSRLES